jgi:formiminoglutamase
MLPDASSPRRPWQADGAPRLPVPTDPPACTLRAPSSDDPRLAHLIGLALAAGEWPDVAIIGFPCDEGVRRNGGRAGAREAPDRIRQALYRFTPTRDSWFTDLLGRTHDFGNLRVPPDLERAQADLGQAIAACLAQGALPIVLGGGHETAYGHFLGYAAAERAVSILNWDAHADVRPLLDGRGHSGSPFRQALEHPSALCAGYTVAGLQPHAAASAHVDYITTRSGQVIWRDGVTPGLIATLYSDDEDSDLLVSFDIDAVDQAFAPGVSAPASGGLTIELWLEAARQAGRSPRVRSIDIVETNPLVDRDDQTARLAALTIWTFLHGLAERS